MTDEENKPQPPHEYEVELGRRLAAAFLSWNLGNAIGYQYEKDLKDKPVGDFWINLGRWVNVKMAEAKKNAAKQRAEADPDSEEEK